MYRSGEMSVAKINGSSNEAMELGSGRSRRIVDLQHIALRGEDAIDDGRSRCDEGQFVFALEPLLDDFHVQQTEETAAEAESEAPRRFPVHRRTTSRSVAISATHPGDLRTGRVRRIEAAKYQWLDFFITWKCLFGRLQRIGQGIADFHVGDFFHIGAEIPDLSRQQLCSLGPFRSELARLP